MVTGKVPPPNFSGIGTPNVTGVTHDERRRPQERIRMIFMGLLVGTIKDCEKGRHGRQGENDILWNLDVGCRDDRDCRDHAASDS